MISRKTIISSLKDLEKDPKVYACWLEGADAHGRVDKYSYIDIWIDVEDNYVSKAFKKIEKLLENIGDIDYSFEKEHSHPKIRQKFYHLKGSSKFLIIDVCIEKHSRVFWYTSGYEDEKVSIIFDKTKVIKFKKLDKKKLKKDTEEKIKALDRAGFGEPVSLSSRAMVLAPNSFFQVWVEKEINRNHFLQSFAAYQKYILIPLVELIRLRYTPTKSGYHLSGISKDNIPQSRFRSGSRAILEQLEDLYKISSLEDIKKMKKANKLYQEVRKGIK
jgi:hypothetical protein